MNPNPLRPPTYPRWAQGAPRPHPADDAAHVPASRRTRLTLLGGLGRVSYWAAEPKDDAA